MFLAERIRKTNFIFEGKTLFSNITINITFRFKFKQPSSAISVTSCAPLLWFVVTFIWYSLHNYTMLGSVIIGLLILPRFSNHTLKTSSNWFKSLQHVNILKHMKIITPLFQDNLRPFFISEHVLVRVESVSAQTSMYDSCFLHHKRIPRSQCI